MRLTLNWGHSCLRRAMLSYYFIFQCSLLYISKIYIWFIVFHFVQDAMNEFVWGKTAAEKGTLFQIRNMFEYRNVKRKTSDCINSCVDLWNFVTEGYICLLACRLCHIKSVEECPKDLLTSNLDHYVQSLSSQIMNTIWPMIQTTGYLNRTAPYCQDADSTFVYAEWGRWNAPWWWWQWRWW